MVTINSGTPEAWEKFEDTPRNKWKTLLNVKRSFLSRRLKHDCRCLIEFCEEAETVWDELGFSSAEDMIRNGYELDPSQIDLAVAWLRANNTTEAIGLDDISKKIAEAKVAAETVTQGKRTELDNNLIKSDRGPTIRNLLKRLARDCPQLLDKIEAGELSVNAAAIQAGIRKKPKPEEVCVKAFGKLDPSDRIAVMRTLLDSLSDDERAKVLWAQPPANPDTFPWPKHVKRTRDKGWQKPDNCVCVTRPPRSSPQKFGNPYETAYEFDQAVRAVQRGEHIGEHHDAIQWIVDNAHTLQGQDLACWCSPACHANVLLRLANPQLGR